MKSFFIIFLLALYTVLTSAKELPIDSRPFLIEKEDIEVLKNLALNGDGSVAAKLARHGYYSDDEEEILESYFWYYIADFLSNYRSGIVLSDILREDGASQPVDVSNIMLKFSSKIEQLKKKDDLFSNLILFHYYLKQKDSSAANIYLSKLKGNVSDKLLMSYENMLKRRDGGCLDRGFLLDKDEVEVFQRLAFAGNGEMALKLFLHYRFSHNLSVEVTVPASNMFLYIAIILNAKNAKEYLPYLKNKDNSIFPNIITKRPTDSIKTTLGETAYNYMNYLYDLYSTKEAAAYPKFPRTQNILVDERLLKKYKFDRNGFVICE